MDHRLGKLVVSVQVAAPDPSRAVPSTEFPHGPQEPTLL
jgi:hypothetical protein